MKNNMKKKGVPLISASKQSSMISEQYRTVRSNIQFSSFDQDIKTIVVTSAGPEEGKSTVSANLAIVFANSGKKTLLIDADLRKPSVESTFRSTSNSEGLTNLLKKRNESAFVFIHETNIAHLWTMTSGPKPPNPFELLESSRMNEIIDELSVNFDLIIFDLPPVVPVTDAKILASKTDGTIIVVRERKTLKQELFKAKELLTIAQANILGIVYNGVKKSKDINYYY